MASLYPQNRSYRTVADVLKIVTNSTLSARLYSPSSKTEADFGARLVVQEKSENPNSPVPFITKEEQLGLTHVEVPTQYDGSSTDDSQSSNRHPREDTLKRVFGRALQLKHVRKLDNRRGPKVDGRQPYGIFSYEFYFQKGVLEVQFLEVETEQTARVRDKDRRTVLNLRLQPGYYVMDVQRVDGSAPSSPTSSQLSSPTASPQRTPQNRHPQQKHQDKPARRPRRVRNRKEGSVTTESDPSQHMGSGSGDETPAISPLSSPTYSGYDSAFDDVLGLSPTVDLIDPAVLLNEPGQSHARKRAASRDLTAEEIDFLAAAIRDAAYGTNRTTSDTAVHVGVQTGAQVAGQAALQSGTQTATQAAAQATTQTAPAVLEALSKGAMKMAHSAGTEAAAKAAANAAAEAAGKKAVEAALKKAAADAAAKASFTATANAAFMAGVGAAAGTVLVDGAGLLRDFYLFKMGIMNAELFAERLVARGWNFLRDLAGSCGGAVLGSVLLTPLVGPFFAPLLGGVLGSVIAALCNDKLPEIKNEEKVVAPMLAAA